MGVGLHTCPASPKPSELLGGPVAGAEANNLWLPGSIETPRVPALPMGTLVPKQRKVRCCVAKFSLFYC